MDRTEIDSAAGRERIDLCVFQVPIGDRLVSMCEVNALGARDRAYEALRGIPAAEAAALRPNGGSVVDGGPEPRTEPFPPF